MFESDDDQSPVFSLPVCLSIEPFCKERLLQVWSTSRGFYSHVFSWFAPALHRFSVCITFDDDDYDDDEEVYVCMSCSTLHSFRTAFRLMFVFLTCIVSMVAVVFANCSEIGSIVFGPRRPPYKSDVTTRESIKATCARTVKTKPKSIRCCEVINKL